MKILITGGAGYIGTELAHMLLKTNKNEVIIFDNLSRKNYNLFLEGHFDSSKISFVHGDILDTRKIKSLVNEVDSVVHLAAVVTTPFSNQDTHQYEQTNHWGTAELVYHCDNSSRLKKFVYLSSAAVYGLSENKNTVDENSPTNPTSYYGISKLRGEKEVELLKGKKEICIIRCANVFGYSRSMRFDSAINRFMFNAHFNNRIDVYGIGKQVRPYISINEVSNKLRNVIVGSTNDDIVNLFEFNLSLDEIINEGILKVYPNTEILFANQEAPPKHLILNKPNETKSLELFLEYLNYFNKQYTF